MKWIQSIALFCNRLELRIIGILMNTEILRESILHKPILDLENLWKVLWNKDWHQILKKVSIKIIYRDLIVNQKAVCTRPNSQLKKPSLSIKS